MMTKNPPPTLAGQSGDFLCLFSVVIDIHCNACAADENITDNAESVRHVAEDEKSENCGENYLRIIIDRDFLCRRTDICLCYSDLPDTCENARQNEIKKLFCRHGGVIKNEKREENKAGKRGEIKNYSVTVFPEFPELADKRICRAGAHPADKPRDSREQVRIVKPRPHTNNPNTFRIGEAFGFFVSIEYPNFNAKK